ncbi:MAG: FAD binding domain-containing protein [Pseudomonadota bacterium]|nr:FAD binding domain-containing protein [Pseudomonadota bacterium]
MRFPTDIAEIASRPGELRAGGTDLSERRRSGRSRGPLVDLRDLPGLGAIELVDGGLRVGAKVTIAALAAHASVPAGLAQAAGGLATPQIRAVATVAGNLSQRVRCWYFRNPEFSCLQSGGTSCLARDGDHLYHSCFDDQACVAPHPSTLACALLAYDATVEVAEAPGAGQVAHGAGAPAAGQAPLLPLAGVLASLQAAHFGRGQPPMIVALRVPTPAAGERAAYVRAIARARAEWPLAEVVVRLSVVDGLVTAARVVVGGVATVPIRREAVEAALVGGAPDEGRIAAAAALASEGARPLPMTGYKLPILVGAVREALERAAGAS